MKSISFIWQLPLCLLLCVAAQAAENWPQFRGPSGQGISDAMNLPLKWSATENVKWTTPIHGKAWSSPVIWKDQIWLTTATEDGHELSVIKVDKNSGKILLDKKLFDIANPQYCHPFNSYASPTPLVEEGRVYVTFGSPGTACLDMATGNVIWERRDFVCNHFRGAGASIYVWNDMLFLPFDGSDFQFVAAMDKNTGKTIWKTPRSIDFQDLTNGKPLNDGDMRKAFSTPRIADFGQGPFLISEGSKCIYAYDPMTGKELWRIEYRAAHSGSATPLIGKDRIYYCTGHQQPEIWAVKPGGHGVLNDSMIDWKSKKAVPTRSSPILVDDLIYFVADNGVVSCIQASDGKDVWRGRIDGTYSVAPIYANGRLYFFNESGKATVLASGRQLKILAENQLGDGFMGGPAVSGDALYLRSKSALYRIEAKQPLAAADGASSAR
ncbi:MAG TPA: PQQ-binding-like beta-propeller repeat protein [Humisphaera sp.]|jgi:outer membrane protein assembly factor BamB|nr:PQQ-binding-like beta-propeller repeat protein [Humisphaera sp.]